MFATLTLPVRDVDNVRIVRRAISESDTLLYGGWLWEIVMFAPDNVVTLRRVLPEWEAGLTPGSVRA